jgi:hypothetical protein
MVSSCWSWSRKAHLPNNALLGEDLAKVGATETTATLNYFRYGKPNPTRPVRCYWQNGSVTEEERAFLDSLQSNDGMCAVVEEHVQRTAELLALAQQLRERHNAETERLGAEADAIIYLVGQVARSTDQAFLDEFQSVTGGRSRALNALGVLAKIDLHPEILDRRHELADKIATQLKSSLNTVVPISAGMQQAVDRLRQREPAGTVDFVATLGRIPSHRLDKLLASEDFFRELEMEDCPVSPAAKAFARLPPARDNGTDPTPPAKRMHQTSVSLLDQLNDSSGLVFRTWPGGLVHFFSFCLWPNGLAAQLDPYGDCHGGQLERDQRPAAACGGGGFGELGGPARPARGAAAPPDRLPARSAAARASGPL